MRKVTLAQCLMQSYTEAVDGFLSISEADLPRDGETMIDYAARFEARFGRNNDPSDTLILYLVRELAAVTPTDADDPEAAISAVEKAASDLSTVASLMRDCQSVRQEPRH